MQKVLFLDIDGVVGSMYTHGGDIQFDPVHVSLVRSIIKETECLVVLSSTWRLSSQGRLHAGALLGAPFDVTPSISFLQRGLEIEAWLKAQEGEVRYAIIDDDDDMLPEQRPHFFRTDGVVGLTPKIVESIITHLNKGGI